MNYKNLVLPTLATVVLMSFTSFSAKAQITSWPISVVYVDVTPGTGCGITMDITYCWKNTGQEKSTRTHTWAMLPSDGSFNPIDEGFEPNGEFSPNDLQPIKAITIDGVTIDINNQCACFSHNGCCFHICLRANLILVEFYDCNGSIWDPCSGVVHNY